MTRAERRRQMKAITKELQYIEKHTPFIKGMQSDEFANMDSDELALLSEGKHKDAGTQQRYLQMKNLFNRVIELNHRYASLKKRADSP